MTPKKDGKSRIVADVSPNSSLEDKELYCQQQNARLEGGSCPFRYWLNPKGGVCLVAKESIEKPKRKKPKRTRGAM